MPGFAGTERKLGGVVLDCLSKSAARESANLLGLRRRGSVASLRALSNASSGVLPSNLAWVALYFARNARICRARNAPRNSSRSPRARPALDHDVALAPRGGAAACRLASRRPSPPAYDTVVPKMETNNDEACTLHRP